MQLIYISTKVCSLKYIQYNVCYTKLFPKSSIPKVEKFRKNEVVRNPK